jgi:uncharacterized membrane protein YkoI
MRTIHRYLATALCGAFVTTAFAEKVRLEQLPQELRDKVRIHAGAAQIEDIDREVRNGKTVYGIAFKRNGQHVELQLDDKGNLMNPAGAQLDARKVTMAELPEPVRKMVEARLRGAAPNDIDRQVRNGEVSYEIGFKQGDKQQEIVISQDGRILRDYELSNSSLAIASVTAQASTNAVALSSKQKVAFESLPEPVRQTVTAAARGARIEDVERGQWRSRTVYEAAFKDQGRHVELQVEENGRIVHDPRIQASTATSSGPAGATSASPAVGSPAARASGAAISSQTAGVTGPVPLSASSKVERSAVPPAVERGILTHAEGARIEDIERGSWNGKTVYEVGFKDKERHVELQLDEQGSVIFDPRKNK